MMVCRNFSNIKSLKKNIKSRKKINMKSLVAELTPGVAELKKIGGKGGFWETVRMNSG